jgi:hypothetical protein
MKDLFFSDIDGCKEIFRLLKIRKVHVYSEEMTSISNVIVTAVKKMYGEMRSVHKVIHFLIALNPSFTMLSLVCSAGDLTFGFF